MNFCREGKKIEPDRKGYKKNQNEKIKINKITTIS